MFTANVRDSFVMQVASIISVLVLVVGVFPVGASALDTGFKSPTDTQSPENWSNGEGAFLDGDNQQSANGWVENRANGEEQGYDEFGFPTITSGSTINGIEVLIDAKADDDSCSLGVRLSWNDGSTYTSQKTSLLGTSEQTKSFGGASDTWGRTWSASDFTDSNFVLKMQAIDTDGSNNNNNSDCRHASDDVEVDWIRVKVHYTAPVTDICPNVNGVQTSGPCADTTCTNEGGTWTNNECVMPQVTICHATGNGWNELSVAANGWNGHSGHEDDFLVDENNPCPPVEEPTEQELCESQEGMVWNGEDCVTEQQAICESYGGEWNGVTCIGLGEELVCTVFDILGLPLPDECTQTPEEACVADGGFWNGEGCEEIPTCTGNQNYNSETNECVDEDVPPVCAENQTLIENECVDNEVAPPEESTPVETPKKRGGGINTVCNDNVDNDGDGRYDMNDPGCSDRKDSSEEDEQGGVGGAAGDVLGTSCPALTSYLGLRGQRNDPEAVKFVQNFLNSELGLTLEVNGEYDAATIEAVKAFQTKYSSEVLGPWGISDSTGIVYKTTQRMINMLSCPGMDFPMPELE